MRPHEIRKRGKGTHVDVPAVENAGNYNNILAKNRLPIVKYLFITKVVDTYTFRYHRRNLRKKGYGIGILTNMNEYYFSEMVMYSNTVNSSSIHNIASILLTRYRYLPSSAILITKNMRFKREPMMAILRIMSMTLKLPIKRCDFDGMLKVLNGSYRLVLGRGGIPIRDTRKIKKQIVKGLLDREVFEFIQDPNFRLKLMDMPNIEKQMTIGCAVGILYMHTVAMKSEYRTELAIERERREKFEREHPDEVYVPPSREMNDDDKKRVGIIF